MSRKLRKQTNRASSNRGGLRGFWDSLLGRNTPSKNSWYSFIEERQEIIAPFMGIYDRRILSEKVNADLYGNGSNRAPSAIENIGFNSVDELTSAVQKMIPNHLIADIYNLFYHQAEVQSYSLIDETNSGKWKLLQKVNDSSVKIMTNGNAVNSSLFTLEICKAIMDAAMKSPKGTITQMGKAMSNSKADHEEEEEENENQSDGNSGGGDQEGENQQSSDGSTQSQNGSGGEQGVPQNSEGSGNNSEGDSQSGGGSESSQKGKDSPGRDMDGASRQKRRSSGSSDGASKSDSQEQRATEFDNLIDKMTKAGLDDLLSKAKQRAFEKIAQYEKLGINPQKMNEYGKHALDLIKDIDAVKGDIEAIQMNGNSIKKVCEKIIDTSISYFSKKSKINEIGIFDADIFDEFEGLEFLNPVFKGTQLENVVTREDVYYGKINIYVDVSGSMDGRVRISETTISRMLFAKALILKMMDLDLVNRIIPFGNSVKKPIDPPKFLDVVSLTAHCGTSLNNVVIDIIKRAENSLVITDGCDRIDYHSPYGFFLGTPGATFHMNGEGVKFGSEEQLWVFDSQGDDIHPYRR